MERQTLALPLPQQERGEKWAEEQQGGAESDKRAGGRTGEGRPGLEIKLAVVKAEQVLEDVGEARLAGALEHQSPDDVVAHHRLDVRPADEAHERLVVHVRHLHHDVSVESALALDPVQRKRDAQGAGVGLVRVDGVARKDDDGSGRGHGHLVEVRDDDWVAGAADHLGAEALQPRLGGGHEVGDVAVHLLLVPLGEHDDHAAAFALVGDGELLHDRQQLVGPSQD